MLVSIQIARAVAALGVLFWHIEWVYNDISGSGTLGLPPVLWLGGYGVDLFFVISGFIISTMIEKPNAALFDFAKKRVYRIVPFYWAFTIAFIGMYLIGCRLGVKDCRSVEFLTFDSMRYLKSFLILPERMGPILGVGWSLEHEVIFYFLAGMVLISGVFFRVRFLFLILITLFIAGILVHAVIPDIFGIQIWDYHLLSLFHAQFLIGVAIFMLKDRIAVLNYGVLISASLLSFIGVCGVCQHFFGLEAMGDADGFAGVMRVVGFGLSSALLISGLIAAERQGLFKQKAFLWSTCVGALLVIGNASYGLYLSHPIVYGVIGKLYGLVGVPRPLLIPALMIAVFFAILVAVLWYFLVERPFLRWVHTPAKRALISPA